MRQVDVDRELWLACDARADCEEQGERRRNDRELGPAQGKGGDQPDGGERRVAEKPRACCPRHACGAAATSSARGVGTVSSTSRTTSSDETR